MKKQLILILFVVALNVSCRKTPDYDKLSVDFVVQTSKDPDANFKNYKTFSIPDFIKLRTTNPNDTIWDDQDAIKLLDQVSQNLISRGYTKVDLGANPDLGVTMTAIKDLNIGVIYPGWWWGYWGCYWGYCYYPPYYPWGAIYTIPTGTLIVDMIDLKDAGNEQKLVVKWGSVMSGGLGYTNDDIQLGIKAIDQSFVQSPYIQAN
ncbi:MAG: hypothetical protein C5B52_05305 [Bacteroidetes bacterium]|nr:MAG: hypothetical protein C5B52_05305 [Bacteroidota bacterium]